MRKLQSEVTELKGSAGETKKLNEGFGIRVAALWRKISEFQDKM